MAEPTKVDPKELDLDLSNLDAGVRTSIEKILALYSEAESRRFDLYRQTGVALQFARDRAVLAGTAPVRLKRVELHSRHGESMLDPDMPIDPIFGMPKDDPPRGI